MIPSLYILYLSAFLFSVGLMIIVIKQNAIAVLLGIELLLNAANLNLIAFSQVHPQALTGQVFALFVIVVAVCEAAVGLAIVLRVYKYYQTSVLTEITELKE
jgi:NADH:ubiquinone oxidoreductase subunit K